MPPDLPNEQEIILKKRARRRLVGAIALVLLMVIILPSILQDRAELTTAQESIKVTMPESANEVAQPSSSVSSAAESLPVVENADQATMASSPSPTEALASEGNSVDAKAVVTEVVHPVANAVPVENTNAVATVDKTNKVAVEASKVSDSNTPGLAANEVKISETKVVEPKVNKPKVSESKQVESKVIQPKPSQTKAIEEKSKTASSFSVQVGVFSDEAKVKHLQSKLKEIGYSSHTEKLTTPKGEKIRLRAGSFSTRQNAVSAQANIKKIGLDGMVVSND